ncbi:MAG: exodeoxyribonuclease VII large subunit, partial [Candidatus Omnitrophota bacterium]
RGKRSRERAEAISKEIASLTTFVRNDRMDRVVRNDRGSDLIDDMKNAIVYTVTQVTKELRSILEEVFGKVWVEGEVSNFTVSSAGHAYFSLKDENSLLNCVMFRNSGSKLKFDITDGMQVITSGRISIYDKRGQYQLYVTEVEPKGKGALQVAFEQLKGKLSKEGLFDEEHKKALPFFPRHVGVVTSPTGAAIKDILKVARRRFDNIEISIRPVRVQGDEAAGEIREAIKELNEYNDHIIRAKAQDFPIDVIIVGRGGGSIEDLWPFNDEEVARAIYASKVPIVSAVGHEIDHTIADFVADFRAPTPSAAAEIVFPRKDELIDRVKTLRKDLYMSMRSGTQRLKETVDALCGSYVLKTPVNVILRIKQEVDDMVSSITTHVTHFMEIKSRDLGILAGKLNMLSPLAVLERGYSITLKDGKVLKRTKTIKKDDLLETRFASGKISSKVVEVKKA